METRKVNVLEDDEWLWMRRLIDEKCPFHRGGPFVKGMAGTRNPCYHLTLGKIRGIEIALNNLYQEYKRMKDRVNELREAP